MKVREIVTSNVRCIGPDTSLKDAAMLMNDLDVGALPLKGVSQPSDAHTT